MIAQRMQYGLPGAIMAVTIALLVGAPGAYAAEEAPVKEILSAHFGSEVDTVTKGNVCTIASGHECQPAKPGSEPGGFEYSNGVAVDNDPASAQHGDVYVADGVNRRVQVLTPSGVFVLMFGWDVNKTKVTKGGATQQEMNVCTETEIKAGGECQRGVEGSAAGQFGEVIFSVTVDPDTGNVYVEDFVNNRVQEFTATGEFVLMVGREVNETTKGNVCSAASNNKCKAGVPGAQGGAEPGAFSLAFSYGDLLAAGGPEDLLYVGDEHRVQEFKADGIWVREVPLTSISSTPNSAVTALAVDKTGSIYLVYRVNEIADTVREFNPTGEETKSFELTPRETGATGATVSGFEIDAIALDPAGRLAVTERELLAINGESITVFRGSLYEVGATSLHLLTEFSNDFKFTSQGMAFGDNDKLYTAGEHEVNAYVPLPVAELLASPATCQTGAEKETDVTFDCSLNGEADPWKVSETEVFFEWGKTLALGSLTPRQPVVEKEPAKPLKVTALVGSALEPNETFHYRLAGYDHNVKEPESALHSETASFTTETVPPRVPGEPSVSFVKAFSAVMFGELNPENAKTEYLFEYGPCAGLAGCEGVLRTKLLKSAAYGKIATTLEATGLRPATTYSYRLVAVNEKKQQVDGREGSFTTAPAPVPQPQTGMASVIGTTSATISGTVNPDGQATTYTFELGVYNGAGTRYGVVFSGSAGTGSVPVAESLGLSGLQPGTTYAYRIVVKAGAGNPVQGEPVTFTTAGLPSVLVVPTPLAMLAIPNIAFPAAATSKPPTKALTNAQKLAKALKACKKKVRHVNRKKCEKEARAKYGPRSKKAVRKK